MGDDYAAGARPKISQGSIERRGSELRITPEVIAHRDATVLSHMA